MALYQDRGVYKVKTRKTKRCFVTSMIAAAVMASCVNVQAATVPAGVELAKEQVLVRNNGAEVSSLDPHKIEGVPESNVARDLYEGLVISDPDGHPIPGVAERWESSDFKVWTFHLRKDAKL